MTGSPNDVRQIAGSRISDGGWRSKARCASTPAGSNALVAPAACKKARRVEKRGIGNYSRNAGATKIDEAMHPVNGGENQSCYGARKSFSGFKLGAAICRRSRALLEAQGSASSRSRDRAR